MSQFEFLLILAGVVIGIAMAEIVSGWGRVVRSPIPIRFDWIQSGWTLVILLNAMIYWVGIWPYSNSGVEYLGQVFFLVAPTLFLVIIAFAITPVEFSGHQFSMRDYYMERRRPIFLFYAIFSVVSTLADYVLGVLRASPFEIGFNLLFVVPLIFLAFTTRALVHGAFMVIYLAAMLAAGFITLDTMMGRFDGA